ncbi:helix-turn-helix domain-containing protein [Glaciihabitans sp. dw_435]|uniref:helix-turn-helix domain-containing protein n=1 Tax=Glaciihabitans sp. dw_435 TaxID=2720081 RepID=UPI001BD2DBDB|nr:helix-turn-helix domain-containing protein [Glaciihabitans sp. dw_435]
MSQTFEVSVARRPEGSAPEAEPASGYLTRALHLLDRCQFGPVLVSRLVAQPRLPRDSSPFVPSGDATIIAIVMSGSVTLTLDVREVVVATGQLMIFELRSLVAFVPSPDFKVVALRLADGVLDLTPAERRELAAIPLDATRGAGSVVRATTAQLYRNRRALPASTNEQFGHSLVALVTVVIDERLERVPGAEFAHRATVKAARRYIDANLWNSRLSPSMVAAAQQISVRALHQAFEGEPNTVARLIAIRRLAGARSDLEVAVGRGISIGSIATRWGFTSASHFSRSFREAFGSSPTQWQADHNAAT